MMNGIPIDVSQMKTFEAIKGEDAKDTRLLKEMMIEANSFLSSHEWCDHVDSLYFAYGVGGIIAIFLAQITPYSSEVDKCLWVIVGDIPAAYIVADDNPTVADALDAYCLEMDTWVKAVNEGESVDDLIPVNVSPTPEYAEQLRGRLEYIRSNILPLALAG